MKDTGYSHTLKANIMRATGNPAQRFCALCGRTDNFIENAHMLPKSIGGDGGPTNPLCKKCHGSHDDYEWFPRPVFDHDGATVGWMAKPADESFAAYLSKRLNKSVHVGGEYPLTFGEDDRDEVFPDSEVDEELEHLACSENTCRRKEAEWWRMRANYTARAFALCDKRAQFKEWRENAGIPKHEAPKMLLVAAWLDGDDLSGVTPYVQHLAAKAIQEGRDYSKVVADAAVLSGSSFKDKWWPKDDPKPDPDPPLSECPTCQSRVPKERLEEEK